ncbi:MAG TPA: amino acid adenylation domain-containing protein [Thermoanaerobaculia bacterium]|jgi:amino acid adenylation domain-containing protein|nr:amino acid adenylation domain-containing protein [Thermoanaerobaculia bacterium]
MIQDVVEGFRLSPNQERLWRLYHDRRGLPSHAVGFAAVEGEIDAALLERALGRTVARHEVLRTAVRPLSGTGMPVQVISAAGEVPLRCFDLGGQPAEEQERELERLPGALCQPLAGDEDGSGFAALLATLGPGRSALVLALPTLCSDAVTFDLLIAEIARCYAAELAGDLVAGEPMQFADIAAWQFDLRAAPESASGATFWRRLGTNGEVAPRLPFAAIAPVLSPRFAPASVRRELARARTVRLEDLARRTGTEVPEVLLALWRVLLERLAETRPMIGVAFPGRDHEEVRDVLGVLSSYVPVVSELEADLAFELAVVAISRSARTSRQFQEDFDWSLLAPGGGAEEPAFGFCFDFGAQPPWRDAGAVSFRLERWRTFNERFQLRLSCLRRDDELELSFDYDAAVLEEAVVERLSAWYLELLDQALAAPERPVSAFELLAAADHAALAALNDTALDFGPAGTLHGRFAAQATSAPERIAAVFGRDEITYGELRRRAADLAAYLRAAGVGPGSRVGLCVPRSLEMIVGIFGILEAGGAYVPLDPAYPGERLAFMLADSRAEVVLTRRGAAAGLPASGHRLFYLDEPGGAPPAAGSAVPALPDSLAYVIYTSGSTGQPKGVMISHRAILNRLLWMQHAYQLGPDDRVLQKTPYSFDASVWEIFSPLLAGACLVVAEPDGHRDPGYLVSVIAAHGVTTAQFVPSQLGPVLDEPGFAAAARSLRRVFCGGEALPSELCSRFFSRSSAELCNLYGPTEVAIDATSHFCQPGIDAKAEAGGVPIGRPLANVRVYILDAAQRLLPPGLPGELCVAGAGVARGYCERPAVTAERFLPDAWSPVAGGRMYRTGDLARLRAESGEIEFLGRIDDQVKVRGFRVELGEIKALLASHPAVREAVVIVRSQRLVGYAVLGGVGELPTAKGLRAFLAAHLPELMVPDVVILKALPRLPSGKLDRGALPEPVRERAGKAPRRRPLNDFEALLASLWTEVLGVDDVGEEDDFFANGGHSLMAIQLISRIREVIGVDLGVRTLFNEPTFGGLAAAVSRAIAARLREEGDEEAIRPEALSGAALHQLALRLKSRQTAAQPIRPQHSSEGPHPLSFAQERLWFLEQLEPGTAFYNIPGAVRLQGGLRPEVLASSLGVLVARHAALRTTFGDRDGRPYQVVSPRVEIGLPLIDLSALPPAGWEHEIGRLVNTETRRPFDLTRGPLMRVVLYRLAARDHVLVHTLHHIISDGWSSEIFVRELTALYRAACAGLPSPFPPLPLQYADYAVAQREYLVGERLENQLAYWRRQLAGSTGLELLGDRPRPAVETFRGMSRPVKMDGATTRGLHALAQSSGVTLFMTMLAAFQTLLWRYTGQTDVPVGSPIANRNRRELESVFGFFANTVVLRTDLSGAPTFTAVLRRVSEVTLGAYAHDELPFERLVEELQPERDMSRNPLFQIMFVLQNQPREEIALEDLSVSPLPVDSATAKFDLTMFWREEQGELAGVVEHNSDLFDLTTAVRFYRHYESLIAAVLADPERPIDELPLLAPEERHQLLVEWNDVAATATREVCAHEWVEEQVALSPDDLAVVFAGRRLTYRELNATANRWAHGLRRRGVGPESLVGICVERSLGMVVAALAVLKAGGAIVALDPAYPRERLATIIQDSGLTLLLTEESLLRHFPGHRDIALCVDGADPFAGESEENPASRVTADSPMYVIYTSGSTGTPKGIVVPHRQFVNLLQWQLADSPLRGRARTAQFATFGFCVSFQEIFTSWCRQGTLVVVDEMTRRDIDGLGAFVAAEGIERLHLPYAALKHLAEVLSKRPDLPALREVITAGEQLRVTPAVRALFESLPGCTLHNQYGASETHVVSSLTLTGAPVDWPALPSVGRTIAHVRIHLLNECLEPVPVGVVGELHAGGVAVPRGYHDDPELTAQKMIPDPLSGRAGERLYRTGDLARYLADGRIEYLGRRDGQVKIRGFRVELGEVETVLARAPGLRDVAVVAQPAPGEGQRLVAYLVPEEEPGPPFEDLRTYLRQLLPEYMVPAAFKVISALPLNANGKLDQAALPFVEAEERSAAYTAPRDAAEERLASIWAEVLGVERVGVGDNFFELGGHSLLATQVLSRVESAFGVAVPLRALFEEPSVAALARRVAAARPEASATIRPRAEPGPPPLSFAQQRLWFLDQWEPGSAVYVIGSGQRVSGALDPAVLAGALAAIVARHEVLRAIVPLAAGRPVQRLLPPWHPLTVIDLTGLPAALREAEGLRLAEAALTVPFDLARGPLFRAALALLAPGEQIFLLAVHHIAADGWSVDVLRGETAALYAAFAVGKPSPLPPLALQYGDFAAWQRERLSGPELDRLLAYWRGALAGAPALLELPADRPRPAVATSRGSAVPVEVPPELAAGLLDLSRSAGATLFMTLLAGFAVLLARSAAVEDLVVGTPVAQRERLETEPLVGLFANLLPLRVRLAGEPAFREVLARVRAIVLGALEHQEMPFEKLVDDLGVAREPSHPPVFQTVFALQNTPRTGIALPGAVLSSLSLASRTSKFDLSLTLAETGPRLAGDLEYRTDLFEAATVERMARHLLVLLAGAAAEPGRPAHELPWLAAAETAQLLGAWNGWAEHRTGLLHRRFAERAALRPDAVAVTCEGESLTYRELAARAGRLAGALRCAGAGPETVVGLCAAPSLDLITSMLGILMAGAAYLPLDPDSPPERLAGLMAQAGARIAVTGEGGAGRLPEGDWVEVSAEAAEEGWVMGKGGQEGEGPDRLAYILFTSGSTGRPKGVAVTHANVTRLLAACRDAVGFGEDDVWTLFHSFAFDFSVWEIWGALLFGGRLVVVPPVARRGPELLLDLLRRERVTVLSQTPTAFLPLIRAAGGNIPPSLRRVVFGGEALEPGSVRGWLAADGRGPLLINMYGITETTVHVTHHLVTAADAGRPASPIGRPLSDLRIHLLDDRLRLVPVGVTGEICVAGAGLARGYAGAPDLTAERFLPDPFGRAPGARLYRSGDLARRRPDGRLDYLGRRDAQVKVRGFRIEPAEIEAALRRHPAVRDAVVLARPGPEGQRLIAWVTAGTGELPPTEELRAAVQAVLPAYMVPAVFVPLAAVPRTPNGKVDRRALPDPGTERPGLATGYAAPRDAVEEVIAAVWAEALGLERVGVHDNFFALGGDSILSLRVRALAEERGVRFTLPQLFALQTVAELAREAEAVDAAAGVEEAEPVRAFTLISAADRALLPPDMEDAYPLTSVQAGMLYHMAYLPEAIVYHNVYSYHLRAAWGEDAFRAAVRRTVARHPILRTSFDLATASEPLQRVHREAELPIEVHDLSALSSDEQELRLAAFMEAEKARRFDLTRPPLVRFALHRRTEESFNFSFAECHPIFDGWSLHSFLNEIFATYLALVAGRELPADPPPRLAIADFVALEREALESPACRAFWEAKLAGCSPTVLPWMRGAAHRTATSRSNCLSRAWVPPEVNASLRALAHAAAVPFKSVLLTAHATALAAWGGEREVLTGLLVNGRPEGRDGDRILGLFFNAVPLRVSLPGGAWSDRVRAVFAAERELLPHRRYPLAQLQKSRGGAPLFTVLFNFLHFHMLRGLLTSGELTLLEDARRWDETNFPLGVVFMQDPAGDDVNLLLRYDLSETRPEDVERLLASYLAILGAMAAGEAERPWLSDIERHQVLQEWNDTARSGPPPLFPELFAARVRESPDAPAVAFEDEALTYGELAAGARRLARRLRRLGVGTESRVGLLLRRSTDLVVTLLGVLEAGAAYVPLDPLHPAERLARLAAEARLAALVTNEATLTALTLPLPEGGPAVIRLDADAPLLSVESGEPLELDRPAASAAYVLFTSGSTGEPKGVVVEHRQLASYLTGVLERLPLPPGGAYALVSTFAADLGNTAIFPCLATGGCLHVIGEERSADAAALAEYFERRPVDVLKIVPSHLAALLSGAQPERFLPRACLVLGGEALDPALVRAAAALRPEMAVFNHYGPTETTVGVAACRAWPETGAPIGETVPLGRPLPRTEILVLNDEDGELRPVLPGAPGDLCVAGAGLARGYLGRPDLTAERFVPHPSSTEPGARLYLTGDRARHRADGRLEFLGRRDGQVKVRGFRIELREIEVALARHPAVRECAVTLHADPAQPHGDRQLVAFCVAPAGIEPAEDGELRGFLRRNLPSPMLPAAYVWLEALPRNANGKLDRRALPEVGSLFAAWRARYTAPRSELERSIAAVWQEVLQVPRIGVDDNFFDLGGHSLVMLRLHSVLRRVLGRDLPMTALFEHPTVGSLAAHLSRASDPPPAGAPEATPETAAAAARGAARHAAIRRRQRAQDLADAEEAR